MVLSLGIVGLGKMGSHLAMQAAEKGMHVVAHSKHRHPDMESKGVRTESDYVAFAAALQKPRIIYLSVPAGPTVDEVLDALVPCLAKGDVVMDGGNSFYLDSVEREKELAKDGIFFLDCGTSGGVEGARNGACFMVGGKKEGFLIAEPVLKALAVEGGLVYTGPSGSGHYVKLVHNGIEFVMNHGIGDGVELLLHGDYDLDLEAIFDNWSHGSVIRGWLVELMAQGLKEKKFSDIPTHIEDTGEVNWLVELAADKEISIPFIALAVMELFESRGSGYDRARAVALLRHEYGGHPFGRDEHLAKERRTSRLTKL